MAIQNLGYKNSLNLTISLCLIYTLCIALLRVWIRKSAYGVDDAIIAASTVISLGHTASDYVGLHFGLGLSWARLEAGPNLETVDGASISGVVTFIVALYLSKCAMLAFLSRITKDQSQIRLYHSFNAAVAVVGFVSALIATVGCPTSSGYYWAFHANRDSCPSQSIRWQTITGLDIITEIIVLALPVHLVWGLQMPWSRKAMVITAFYLRLPALGFSIGRNYYTLRLRLPSSDAGLDSALVVIWLEIQLAWALAASTLSALKAFTANFNSGFGLGFTRGKGEGDSYGMSGVSSGKSTKNEMDTSQVSAAATESLYRKAARQGRNPLQTPRESSELERGLKLIPEPEIKTITHVRASPNSAPQERADARNSQNMVIHCETGYEVRRDSPHVLGGRLPAPSRIYDYYGCVLPGDLD